MLLTDIVIEPPAPEKQNARRARRPARGKGVRRRHITRERVLAAAEKLFLEKGFRATSIDDIAAAAGYTIGAIYSSFGGKDHLFLAVNDRHATSEVEAWKERLERVNDPADALAALVAA